MRKLWAFGDCVLALVHSVSRISHCYIIACSYSLAVCVLDSCLKLSYFASASCGFKLLAKWNLLLLCFVFACKLQTLRLCPGPARCLVNTCVTLLQVTPLQASSALHWPLSSNGCHHCNHLLNYWYLPHWESSDNVGSSLSADTTVCQQQQPSLCHSFFPSGKNSKSWQRLHFFIPL